MNLDRELKRFVRLIRPGLIGATSNPNVNLIQVIEELKSSPQRATEFQEALSTFLASQDYTSALTETGLTLELGVFTEIYKRIEYKFLPKLLDNLDILSFLSRIFDSQADADWLERIDRERLSEFFLLIMPSKEKLIEALAPQIFMSLEILSLRLAGLGYDPLVTHRLDSRRELQHSFMDVTRHVHSLLEGAGEEAIPLIRESLARAGDSVRWIRSRRGIDGASLGLTYRLTKIEQVERRMNSLLNLIQAILVEWTPKPAMNLFLEITLAEIRQFELLRFLGRNVELLAYQITEHTGKTGEHYITRTRREWVEMFRSASIGGIIVAFTAVAKAYASKLGLPPGPEALLYGTLYSVGFLTLNALGGTLASKQPAMTASTLAGALDSAKTSDEAMNNLAEIIVRTSRSQFVALLGNYLIAFLAAMLITIPLFYIHIPVMSSDKALHTLDTLHPFKSLSFWYASLAGFYLFISGLLAGFADNWFVFNHVGTRLKQSELLRRWVGAHNLDKVIYRIENGIGFWVGNIALGFFLGSAAAIGRITGLPIDIRHITFSSASFGISMATLKFEIPAALMATIAISVFVMGLFNLAVSFSLSLFVAIKSRRIRFRQTPKLLKILGRRALRSPLEFILPIKDAA